MKTLVASGLLFVFVAACSENNNEPTGVIPQAQKQALENAKNVEGVLKQQERDTRREIDEAQ